MCSSFLGIDLRVYHPGGSESDIVFKNMSDSESMSDSEPPVPAPPPLMKIEQICLLKANIFRSKIVSDRQTGPNWTDSLEPTNLVNLFYR